MTAFARDESTPEKIADERADYEPFTHAVRRLVDATIRTRLAGEELAELREQVDAITAALSEPGLDGPFGVRISPGGKGRNWGNSVVGVRNPIAPPLVTEHNDEPRVWAEFTLGAAYEGPPGLVHGGVSAMVMDQILGEVVARAGTPGMTGTLTVRYLSGTPLGPLRAEGWINRTEGYKTYAAGELTGPDGVTVQAEGVFIQPRWARDRASSDPDN